MTGRDVVEITQAREKCLRALHITLDARTDAKARLAELTAALSPVQAGTVPVRITYQRMEGAVSLALGTQWWVTPTDDLLHQLKQFATIELEFN